VDASLCYAPLVVVVHFGVKVQPPAVEVLRGTEFNPPELHAPNQISVLSEYPSITGVSSGSFTLADDLDHIAPLQAQVF
jgi:hypothetical protein